MANGNPFLIDVGTPAVQQGLAGLGQTFGQIGQQRREDEVKAKSQARFESAQRDIMAAYQSGDPSKLAEVSIKYPEFQQVTKQAFDFANDRTEGIVRSAYSQVLTNPENAEQILSNAVAEVEGQGGNPVFLRRGLEAVRRDPVAGVKAVELDGSPMFPDVHKAYTAQQKARAKQAEVAAEGRRADEQLDLKKEELGLKKQNAELDKLKSQAQKETNDLKKQELQLKIDQREQKIEADQKKVVDASRKALSATERGIASAERLLNHPGLEAAVGLSSVLPTRPGSDAADFEAELEAFDAQIFTQAVETMKGLGALSEAEGRKISAAAGALNKNMSEEAFNRSLMTIKEGMEKAKEFLVQNAPEGAVTEPAAQPSIDDLLNKYGN